MSEYPLARAVTTASTTASARATASPRSEIPAQFIPPHCLARGISARRTRATAALPRLRAQRPVLLRQHPHALLLHVHGQPGGFLRRLRLFAQAGLVHIRQPPHLARQKTMDLGQSRLRLRLGPQSDRSGRATANSAPTSKSWPAFTPTTSPTSASSSPAKPKPGASSGIPSKKSARRSTRTWTPPSA